MATSNDGNMVWTSGPIAMELMRDAQITWSPPEEIKFADSTPQCRAMHAGVWAIEGHWFQTAVRSVSAGTWPMLAAHGDGDAGADFHVQDAGNGIAVIGIEGFMSKGFSKFGGTSTVAVRQAFRAAAQDPSVKGILLHVDSPGGTVAGTSDLADDIRAANKVKPVFAQIDDLGASAAYWVAAQARFIGANKTAEIGSIGAFAVVEDTSKATEDAGIKVHVISSAAGKGMLADGVPVMDEALKMVQEQVDAFGVFFNDAVAQGRVMPIAEVRKLADGHTHLAAKAKDLNLIDAVQSLDETMAGLRRVIKAEAKAKEPSKVASAGRRMRMAGA